MGQQGAVWTRIAMGRESWRTVVEGYFPQWKDTVQNRTEQSVSANTKTVLVRVLACNQETTISLPVLEAATPKLQPVRQPPQTEQTRAGYSVQAENWAQQT